MDHELSPEATKLLAAALLAAKNDHVCSDASDRATKALCDYVAQLEARVAGLKARLT
jgi:hypothetical protein